MSGPSKALRRARRAIPLTIVGGLAIALLPATSAGAAPPTTPQKPTSTAVVGEYTSNLAPVEATPVPAFKAAMQSQMMAQRQSGATANALAATTSKALSIEYLVQPSNSAWCGPTTLADVADYRGMGWGGTTWNKESSAANLLGVSEYGGGTPWIGSDSVPIYPYSSQYVMQDALDYLIYKKWGHTWYASIGLPGNPTSSDVSTYKNNLTFDIDATYDSRAGFPLAVNEYAAPGFQLQKQPSNEWIMHWFAASGYYSSGAGTYFSDPGWGGGTRSYDSSTKVVTAAGGRGYVW